MAKDPVPELIQAAREVVEPRKVLSSDEDGSSIDPCGLRETNFDMMNEVLDGLNNVARHKVVMEEGGWQALPRARLSPEPTPDRVRTALTLAAEAGLR